MEAFSPPRENRVEEGGLCSKGSDSFASVAVLRPLTFPCSENGNHFKLGQNKSQ
ncbi:hypothetical protein ACRRTK_022446 [Alexandromys fortis]